VVVTHNQIRIGGINDTPENIGFLGYLDTKLPKKIPPSLEDFSPAAYCLLPCGSQFDIGLPISAAFKYSYGAAARNEANAPLALTVESLFHPPKCHSKAKNSLFLLRVDS